MDPEFSENMSQFKSQFKSLPYDEDAGSGRWRCEGVELVSRQFGGKFTGELAANEGNLV